MFTQLVNGGPSLKPKQSGSRVCAFNHYIKLPLIEHLLAASTELNALYMIVQLTSTISILVLQI